MEAETQRLLVAVAGIVAAFNGIGAVAIAWIGLRATDQRESLKVRRQAAGAWVSAAISALREVDLILMRDQPDLASGVLVAESLAEDTRPVGDLTQAFAAARLSFASQSLVAKLDVAGDQIRMALIAARGHYDSGEGLSTAVECRNLGHDALDTAIAALQGELGVA